MTVTKTALKFSFDNLTGGLPLAEKLAGSTFARAHGSFLAALTNIGRTPDDLNAALQSGGSRRYAAIILESGHELVYNNPDFAEGLVIGYGFTQLLLSATGEENCEEDEDLRGIFEGLCTEGHLVQFRKEQEAARAESREPIPGRLPEAGGAKFIELARAWIAGAGAAADR